jgi:hypothetical protein
MASTYSNIKIQLMTTGENTTTWGNVTNDNFQYAVEEAIVGSASVAFSNASVTLTLTDTNATQSARNMRLNLTGTATSGYNLVLGSGCQINKPYIINNGTDGTITVKNTTGTGIAVPAGKTMWVYNNGTNVVDAVTHLTSLTTTGDLAVGANATFGASVTTGTGVSTGDCAIELGGNRSGNGASFLDFHSAAGTDFEARMVRYSGTNGGMDIINNGTGGMVLSVEGAGDMVLKTTATERVRVLSGGNFGIGMSPGCKFDVYGRGRFMQDAAATTGAVTIRQNVGDTVGGFIQWVNNAASVEKGWMVVDTSSNMIFATGSTERFRIGSSGQLGLTGANYGTSGQVLTSQGASAAPIWSSAGTVSSVGGTGSVNGLTLTGTVTSSGNLTLGGDITSVNASATINGITIGYRSIPRSTTSGTATTSDVGKCIAVTAGITIPNSTFAAGDAISIYNNSSSSITITQGSGLTMYQVGTATTGNRTLAQRGVATIWFNSATDCVISGGGLS